MKSIFLISVAFLLLSCSQRVFNNKVAASTLSTAIPQHEVMGQVEKRSCSRGFLFYMVSPDFKKVYDMIMEDAVALGGNAIKDLQVRPDSELFLAGFLNHFCVVTTGTAIKVKGQGFSGGSSVWDSPGSLTPQDTNGKSPWDKP